MADQPLNAPVPNLPLLRKVLDHIDAHPEEWDQRWWELDHSDSEYRVEDGLPESCGTTRCIAGWVQFWGEGKVGINPSRYAQDALGLTDAEAYDLFEGETLAALRRTEDRVAQRVAIQRVAERIAERAGERL